MLSDWNVYYRNISFRTFLTAWKPIGGAKLSLDKSNPLSDALKTVLRVDIPAGATGEVGFLNEGWWGFDVKPQPYKASFYIKPSASGSTPGQQATGLYLSLRSNSTKDIWAQEWIDFSTLNSTGYTQFNKVLNPTSKAPNVKNIFAITFRANETAGQTFYFSLLSLFPPTYKNRPNGLRVDLAEHLAALQPKFLRFPGGNNLEGISVDTRWQWKKNIGPLINRPGRPGNWDYYNTDGLGYLEFLEWCEDMEMEPLLTVYAGYSLGNPKTTVPQADLDIYIQEAIDQLEYAMGGANTTWGAMRLHTDILNRSKSR